MGSPKSPNQANPSPPDSPKPTKELVIHVNSFDDLEEEEEEEEDYRSSLHLEDGDEYDSDTSSRITTSSSYMESSLGSVFPQPLSANLVFLSYLARSPAEGR